MFYNQFEYAVGFSLCEANCLRDLSHNNIDFNFNRRREWQDIAIQRWSKVKNPSLGQHYKTLVARKKTLTEQTLENLHLVADTLLDSGAEYKLVVTIDYGNIYTNDMKLIRQLSKLDCLKNTVYSRAQVTRPINTVALKNPKHNFRSYIKVTRLTVEQKNQLQDFLQNQPTVRLSPALQNWIDGYFVRTQDWFFIDHNEMSWLTMLALVRPGIIRKTQQIVQAK